MSPALLDVVPAAAGGGAVAHVLVALATVIVAARLVGAIFQRLGQPAVIGEILAGILLGPSALGSISPGMSRLLLPADAVSFFGLISQFGVIFYMFLVGVELDASHLRARGRAAVVISTTSILVPFALGAALAPRLHASYASPAVPFTAFALFLGVAMSITAFPVLARILGARGLQRSPLGVLALTAAAINDVTAWCLLALVVGVVGAALGNVAWTVGLTGAYIAVMFLAVAPGVHRFLRRRTEGSDDRAAIAIALIGLLLSALITESIGIHAVFGAFLAGVVIPADSPLAKQLVTRLEDVTVVLFLPVFFAYTGLRTSIGQIDSGAQWLTCAGIVLLASIGKIGGTWFGAWIAGSGNRDALTLGILMNTRGLMELIVLNVALDLGILSPTLFTMMVVMAVVTTFMTSPLLDLIAPAPPPKAARAG